MCTVLVSLNRCGLHTLYRGDDLAEAKRVADWARGHYEEVVCVGFKPKNAGLPGFDADTGEPMALSEKLANLTMN